MSAQEPNPQAAPGSTPLRALVRASRHLAAQSTPAQALWNLISALREDLAIDRAGVFVYDHASNTLDRVAGVDRHGRAEFSGQSFLVDDQFCPIKQVARRELPYYFSDDARRDYPDCEWAPGLRAHSIIPIIVADHFLGALCVDNCLSGRPMLPSLLEPLFLYASLAALPLFALRQEKERERVDAMRRHIYREVLFSVTSGKIHLCDRTEIDREWPGLEGALSVEREEDIRRVRDLARRMGLDAGMTEDRAQEFALCASEAATNALLHGSGGAATVACIERRLRIRIADQGDGIDPDDLPRATLLKGWSKRASMGLGFTIINETADRLYLYTGPTGTTLIVEMGVEPDANLPEECNPLLWGEAFSL
jgi:anti-sigma regulatory factor (Ser/Thr protein kinase)